MYNTIVGLFCTLCFVMSGMAASLVKLTFSSFSLSPVLLDKIKVGRNP